MPRVDSKSVVTPMVPLYVQIAESLIEQIESGQLKPGSRLAPERELSKQLGVNRMTLRQALNVLSKRGLLHRRQGDGTYVADSRIEREAGRLFPFSYEMRSRGYTPGARIILLEQRSAELPIAQQLGINVGAVVYYSHRLRLINQEPVMIEKFYLPARHFPGLEQHDLSQRSLYETMASEYGIHIDTARQSLEPVLATPYEAELLGIEAGAPLMLERRLTYDSTGIAVECSKDLYRGDRFRFVTDLALLDTRDAPQVPIRLVR